MNQETYHNEIQTLLTQFIHAFDDCVISRVNKNSEVVDKIKVKYIYSTKSRTLHDIVNKADHITFPVVAIWIQNISRDQNRVFNKITGHYLNSNLNTTTSSHILQPVPVNISIGMSIMTKFHSDLDRIVSNFVPYLDPYIVVSWEREDLENIQINSVIEWDGTLAVKYPFDINDNEPARCICDTSFVIKGWLFKNDAEPVGKIYKITTDFSAHPEILSYSYMENEKEEADSQGVSIYDTRVIDAIPRIYQASPFKYALQSWDLSSFDHTVYLYGTTFFNISGVFLSGANYSLSSYDYFSGTSLSAIYPAFEGYPVDFTIENENLLSIEIPEPTTIGNFDIIIWNDAGYTKLTEDTYNSNFTFQYPTISGFEIY